MNSSKFAGTLVGKPITVYRPRGNKSYSHKDISQYLRRFKLCDALKLIGEVSYQLFEQPRGVVIEKGVPVFDGVLAYISMHLIESSNDYRSSKMTFDHLLIAIDMYFGLPEPDLTVEESPIGHLVRFEASQFDYNRDLRHLLARTLILYRDLWQGTAGAKSIDILQATSKIFGLSLQEILVLGLAFTHRAKKGFLRLYEDIDKYPDYVQTYFEPSKQQKFISFISSSYSEFRSHSRSEKPPSNEYEKFRFNPLLPNPVIIPDRNPKPPFPKPYIAPLPTLISRRVTSGLYFALSDHFRTSTNSQIFPNSFGYVFQEYVGLLLREAIGEEHVFKEWSYGTKKHQKATPDWLVISGGRAVLIEVKKSGLYLESKKWGDVESIQDDLKDSIGHGVRQLYSFEVDLRNEICSLPTEFGDIEITERMVVTYDSLPYLNSFVRDEIQIINPKVPETYHWHGISVEELEFFLGVVGQQFIEALEKKRLSSEQDDMDFREYLFAEYSDKPRNPYLDSVFNDFFDALKIIEMSHES